MWLRSRTIQRLGGGKLEQFGLGLWSRLQLASMNSRKEKKVVNLFKEIHRAKRSLLSAFEQYLIYSVARAQSKHHGAIAEVGVFRGGSARLICEVKGDKPLHLFDTFEGLPESTEEDRGVHRKHQYACGVEDVAAYLKDFDNVHFHKGIFPDSTEGVPDQQYCFAHFDVDLYDGTKACLEYFYPKMIPGGIIISHDYSLLAGVQKAFDEFFEDKPEEIIDQPTTQCMVIKL